MTSIQRVRMTRQDYTRLHQELAALRSRRGIELPNDFMNFDANRLARDRARHTRIREVEDVLINAVINENAFDPIAKPGMVLTLRYDDTGATETFLLGRSGPEDADLTAYSTLSPMGGAIGGARPGDQRIYSIPGGTRRLVTLLKAVPYEMYVAKSRGPQAAHRNQR
jgi:transcription elongation factor GreA